MAGQCREGALLGRHRHACSRGRQAGWQAGSNTALAPYCCPCLLQNAATRGTSVLQAPGDPAALPANVLLVKEVCMERFKALIQAGLDSPLDPRSWEEHRAELSAKIDSARSASRHTAA